MQGSVEKRQFNLQDELFETWAVFQKRMSHLPLFNPLPAIPMCVYMWVLQADSNQPMKWQEFTLSRVQDTHRLRAPKLIF